eukprot:4694844-Pyramimonas_sp.AAC.1
MDDLKSKPKCLKTAAEALAAGRSVVVDNTNPKPEARADYIREARKAGVPVISTPAPPSPSLEEEIDESIIPPEFG